VKGRRTDWLSLVPSRWNRDALFAGLSLLMMVGVTLDFRAHAEGISFAEEGFLTPEHAFFYSMFLAIAAVIGLGTYRRRRAGSSWIEAVPAGYGWGVVGVVLFAFGGVGDLFWHGAFGFEEGVEALVSPSHLMLAVGAALFLGSPLRAALARPEEFEGRRFLPVLVSTSLVLTIIVLFGSLVNPLAQLGYVAGEPVFRTYALGWNALVFFPLLFVATGLVLARRFDVPPGALALTFLVPAVASVTVVGAYRFVLPAVLAGVVADGLVQFARPGPPQGVVLRLYGALFPLVFVATYFGLIAVTFRLTWVVHIWTGTIVMAGLAGLLLTYAIDPGGTRPG